MEISGLQVWGFQLPPSLTHQDSEPSPAAGLGLIFLISRKVLELPFLGTSSGFYHLSPPTPSPVPALSPHPSCSLCVFSSPWSSVPVSVPIPGSCPGSGGDFDSGRGSGYNSQDRNNNSLVTLSQLGSTADRAWLSSFPGMGPSTAPGCDGNLPGWEPGLKITLRNKSRMQRWARHMCKSKIQPLECIQISKKEQAGRRFLLLSVVQGTGWLWLVLCLSSPSRGFHLRRLIPDWFAGERLEALLGEHREMPLWALDFLFASGIPRKSSPGGREEV